MAPVSTGRSRLWLSLGLVALVILGLASRKYPALFPACLGKYPGDALWALVVFVGWALLRPGLATIWLALLALATSCIVEFSQLYQAPWLNAIRGTTLGHLALGSVFSWFDIAAYAVGISIAMGLDVLLRGAASIGTRKLQAVRNAANIHPTQE